MKKHLLGRKSSRATVCIVTLEEAAVRIPDGRRPDLSFICVSVSASLCIFTQSI